MATPRNIYKEDVDFSVLALTDGEFAKRLKTNGQLDFSDPRAVQALTKALLKRDFNIEIELPDDRLCPPAPNRFNYTLWIQDLLDTTSDDYNDRYDPQRDVIGLDIGTGASCIYPLLGCSQRSKWKMLGTDIDDKALEFAKKNISGNNLQQRIRLLNSSSEGPLIPLDKIGIDSIDFTMCNPPFYESEDEMLDSAKKKQRPPLSACTGSPVEMCTPGGEIAFVGRMLQESLVLRNRVQWYTTMLGKHSSVATITKRLIDAGCTNWAVTAFVQGNKTRRWAVGWSWEDRRPTPTVARNLGSLQKNLLPFPSIFTFNIESQAAMSIESLSQHLTSSMGKLDMIWEWRPRIFSGVAFAKGNVWSRSARRSRKKLEVEDVVPTEADMDVDEEAKLGVRIQLVNQENNAAIEVVIRWLKGEDSVLFESFCGWLKRDLEATRVKPAPG